MLLRGGSMSGAARRRKQQQQQQQQQQFQERRQQQSRRGHRHSNAASFFALSMARALDENRQLKIKLDFSIAELEKAEARMAALRTGSHHKSSQSSVEIRHRWLQFASSLPPFEYIDASERETTMEEEQVWIPRTDSPATARRQRRRLRLVLSVDDGPSTSEVDSFEQHIADVQERLLAAEPRLASPDPETTELDCEDTSEINEHQDPSTSDILKAQDKL
uniref:Uncharacterized protein n=1 Tax=Macrostomum lignano TaxID=282301 RepID=A0A1I8IZV2_9PLAT